MLNQAAILDLIETIYLCGSGNAHWQEFLNQYGRLFPALKIGLTGYDNQFSQLEVFSTSNIDPDFLESFKTHYYKINPWQKVVSNSPPTPQVAWGHDAVPIRELQKTEFYAGWIAPQEDVATGFTTMLVKEKDRFVNLSANVSVKNIKEAQRAAQALAVIGPHLRRAFELHRQLMGAQILQDSYQSALNMLPSAVFVVDATGKIQFSNLKGERLLQQENIVKTDTTGRLSFPDARDHRAVSESIRRTAALKADHEGPVIPLHVAVKGRYLAFVTVLSTQPHAPVRRSSTFLLPGLPIAVFVIDSQEMPRTTIETVKRALNVTPAEARLALALLHDKSLKDYADRNAISIHTARTQMRSLLEKSGTRKQATLVRRLTNIFGAIEVT